jgi:hypothetical protein
MEEFVVDLTERTARHPSGAFASFYEYEEEKDWLRSEAGASQ